MLRAAVVNYSPLSLCTIPQPPSSSSLSVPLLSGTLYFQAARLCSPGLYSPLEPGFRGWFYTEKWQSGGTTMFFWVTTDRQTRGSLALTPAKLIGGGKMCYSPKKAVWDGGEEASAWYFCLLSGAGGCAGRQLPRRAAWPRAYLREAALPFSCGKQQISIPELSRRSRSPSGDPRALVGDPPARWRAHGSLNKALQPRRSAARHGVIPPVRLGETGRRRDSLGKR